MPLILEHIYVTLMLQALMPQLNDDSMGTYQMGINVDVPSACKSI